MRRTSTQRGHSPIIWASAIVIVILFTAVAYRVVTQCENSTFQLMKYIQVQLGGCKLNDETTKTPKWVVYFEYDQGSPNNSGVATIEDAYQWFYQHPGKKILVEGHATSEEGAQQKLEEGQEKIGTATIEYAIALSDRRAKAVASRLILRGIIPSKVETVGYGLSRPIATGTEFADAKNRRAEITIEDDEKH
ncbi:OmpA family protein [Pseudomonas sp. Q11]|uniref:OmpA family protein n=1 Tax=Pseudomonas sp. Q11 TaxID=2968470 RepID=UPI00210A1808|nr:OmpA family protein [Pseudomonas sp. Q11]MCQ6256206.1 OmpA family protein [Pseudomonas sp. Q11]